MAKIGDLNKRLRHQQNVSKTEITRNNAERTMRQSVEKLLSNKRYQRVVFIIDRRSKGDKDMSYCYQPNIESDGIECWQIERDLNKFLHERLIQNSKICLIPQLKGENANIGINRGLGDLLTFSFHCYAANETRVYCCYNGWGTRFFPQDIKYYLPGYILYIIFVYIIYIYHIILFIHTYNKYLHRILCKGTGREIKMGI